MKTLILKTWLTNTSKALRVDGGCLVLLSMAVAATARKATLQTS